MWPARDARGRMGWHREPLVNACAHGVTLGRQATAVPSHRVQHIGAMHALVARKDICRGVALGMTDVQQAVQRHDAAAGVDQGLQVRLLLTAARLAPDQHAGIAGA
jgi:hypothetical protein